MITEENNEIIYLYNQLQSNKITQANYELRKRANELKISTYQIK